ncbi:MAG: CotH kinase family protein [Alloprevotella sp.]|nr:CotH kinase family protein [Alloprevotella sp.]
MKKTLLALLAGFISVTGAYSQQWIDVTGTYLTNPDFNAGNWNGWTIDHYTTLSGQGGPRCDHGAIELWYCSFRMSQTLSVPNGRYRLSVNGFYRTQELEDAYSSYEADMETIPAMLFANSQQTTLKSIFSESRSDQNGEGSWSAADPWGGWGGGWGGWGGGNTDTQYYPASMEAAEYAFNQGMYTNNVVEVQVTNGQLEIGVVNETFVANNWCMLDNFKLEYYGTPVAVTSVDVSPKEMEIATGELRQLTATVLPENATDKSLKWESSAPTIASVDQQGNVRGIRQGDAVITATSASQPGLSASVKVSVIRNDAVEGSLIINEIMAANVDVFLDPSFNYGGWIELYNPTDRSVSLTDCWITNDPADMQQHPLDWAVQSVPAKGFATVWFDHYSKYCTTQIDDDLDAKGGFICITDGYNILCSEEYPEATARTSWARTTDGGDTWGISTTPTPGASNAGCTFATQRLPEPKPNIDGQIFTGQLIFDIEIPSGATLRYTTDGSAPTLKNGVESRTGHFTVTRTSVYRFGFFQDGKIPSKIATRSFIYRDKEYPLPVLSVVSAPDNFYSDEYGVMVKGVNGKNGYGSSEKRNWNMDWDRPVNFELIMPGDGLSVFNQESNLSICGGWSRENSPHSFKLKGNKKYEGESTLDYPFFAHTKPFIKNKTLQMRTGGNDNRARLKDPALQTIIQSSGLYVDGQSYIPVMSFLNGTYNGIMNMREPNNKHYAYANYGIDTDEMDQFEISPDSQYVQMVGTVDSFNEWRRLSERASEPEVYEEICRMVDIDEYANFWACCLYLAPSDWGRNNIKGFRYSGEGGKWHHVMFDMDSSFGNSFSGNLDRTTDGGDYIYETNSRLGGELPPTIVFRNMLQNATFRKHFIDAYCLVTGSVFEPIRCQQIVDSLVSNIIDVAAYENNENYVNSTASSLISNLSSSRQSTMISQMKSHSLMGLSSTNGITAKLASDLSTARLLVNGQPVPTGKFSGTLFPPITVKAEAPAGYKFTGWRSAYTTNTQTLFNMGSKWSYYDQGSLDDEEWNTPDYKDLNWQDGETPMGFANKDLGFKTNFDSNDKKVTYYFRKKFNLSKKPASTDEFTLDCRVDDGAIVYVNGTEVGRYRMPSGDVSYETLASSYAGDYDNTSFPISPSLLQEGQNTIAVEVHNVGTYSSDIYWDASLTTTMAEGGTNIVSPDAEYELPSYGSADLTATFEPLDAEEKTVNQCHPIKINEVSASNSVFVNELAKKDDWIELYNTTDQPYDVKGMYLSDNMKTPLKYQIEGSEDINTVIPPYGHLIIWASKRNQQSQLHANFKLAAADSAYVILTSADETWSDTLVYCLHNGDESVGLYPDGSNNLYVFNKPTPGKTNLMTSQTLAYEEPVIENPFTGVREQFVSRSGGMSIGYYRTFLRVKSEYSASAVLFIYAADGRLVRRLSLDTSAGYADVPTTDLPVGHYVAKAQDEEGEVCAVKFVRNQFE